MRRATRTRVARFEGLPDGAVVVRRHPPDFERRVSGTNDELTFDVIETVDVPRSRTPLYVGTVLDIVGAASAFFGATQTKDNAGAIALGTYFGLAALTDVVFMGVVDGVSKDRVTQVRSVPTATVTYVLTAGGVTTNATFDPRTTHEARFGIDGPGVGRARVVIVDPPAPRDPEESWYGWQTVAVDAVAMSGFVGGIAHGKGRVVAGSIALYGLGPVVVHAANNRISAAAGSLAVRTAGPIFGGLGGAALGLLALPWIDCGSGVDQRFACTGVVTGVGAAVGAGAASFTAMAIDATAFGWKHRDESPDANSPPVTVVPSVVMSAEGDAQFGFVGRF